MIFTFFNKRKFSSNPFAVVFFLLGYFKVLVTKSTVTSLLEKHIEYPSLLAVQDTLCEYGIDTVAVRKGEYAYSDFETPFICAIQQEDWEHANFTVVTKADNERIEYLHPLTHKLVNVEVTEFEQLDKDVILLLDGVNAKDETNYYSNKKEERTVEFIQKLPIFFLTSVMFVALIRQSSLLLTDNWINFIFLLSSAVGLGLSCLLLWYEIDAHNPFIKEVCGGFGRKTSCEAVLNSRGAKFLGISWSIWGMSYFSAFFFSQVLFSGMSLYNYVWVLISIFATPYIVYSVYYQWKVVQQWCPLCLGIQCVLLLNAIASFTFLFSMSGPFVFAWYPFYIVFVLGFSFVLLTHYGISLIKQALDSSKYEMRWKKLHYHPDIFRAQLTKGNRVSIPSDGLGIVIGNRNARHEIIKVCNPYCGPCSKAHLVLEEIVKKNSDVKVRIIFTATGEEEDERTAPVQHLLAIEENYSPRITMKALDDWYSAESKDYKEFSKKYPMNGELKAQLSKIVSMRDWCVRLKIRATPTLFIDGYEYPENYLISDLRNFF